MLRTLSGTDSRRGVCALRNRDISWPLALRTSNHTLLQSSPSLLHMEGIAPTSLGTSTGMQQVVDELTHSSAGPPPQQHRAPQPTQDTPNVGVELSGAFHFPMS